MVRMLVSEKTCLDPEEAIKACNLLVASKCIEHVADPRIEFKDEYFFYKCNGKTPQFQRQLALYSESGGIEQEVEDIASKAMEGVQICDRTYMLRKYENVFIGSELVKYLVAADIAYNAEDAVRIGQVLMDHQVFTHVTKDHPFMNKRLFYRFKAHQEEHHGSVLKDELGNALSWASKALPSLSSGSGLQPDLNLCFASSNASQIPKASELSIPLSPMDQHNIALLNQVHPKAWNDPVPKAKYNLVVIGAGAGGLVTAAVASGLGAQVALIESDLMGGDCLNIGCVPSKTLLKSAKVAATMKRCQEFGIIVNGSVEVDFEGIMERVRKVRASIAPNDSAQRFAEQLGVDVFLGRGTFISASQIQVNDSILEFSKAVIATGGSADVPTVKGIDSIPYFTNANIFNLTQLPSRIAVIGTGPIGCELGQAFSRFGSQVVMINRSDSVLGKEDSDAGNLIKNALQRDGVHFILNATLTEFSLDRQGDPFPEITIRYTVEGIEDTLTVEAVLFCTGRKANVTGMGLEEANVEYSSKGIIVNDHLQTSQKHIYAVGDCCTDFKFTHVADFMARMVVRNALLFSSARFSDLIIPWVTYTDPEVAHVGLYPRDMVARDIAFDTFTKAFEHNDRAMADGVNEGYIKIHTNKGSDVILGCSIVGSHAGEMISEITVAMTAKMGLGTLASAIHPYPTMAEGIRQCGDMYNRTRLTPLVKSLFRKLMASQR